MRKDRPMRWRWLAAIWLLTGCGVTAAPTSATQATTLPTTSQATATTRTNPAASTVTTPDFIDLLRQDLASYLGVSADTVQFISSEARTWPDAGLGCRVRRGVYETQPVPGFLIILRSQDQEYRYHTDQNGEFVRCDPGTTLPDPKTR